MSIVDEKDVFRLTTLNMLHDRFRLEERVNKVANELFTLDSDIFCAQEVILNEGYLSKSITQLEELTGLKTIVFSAIRRPKGDIDSGAVIMAKWPSLESGSINVPDGYADRFNGVYAVLQSPTGRLVIVFSIHGAHGGENEFLREKQFIEIDRQAKLLEEKYHSQGKECLTYIMGDFNMENDSSTMRYLLGKSPINEQGAYWSDAWDMTNDDTGYTFDPENKLTIKTALGHGIYLPNLLPPRRIDYILAKGWVYGKVGTPISSELSFNTMDKDGYYPSDHYGITADIWNPMDLPNS